MTKIYEIELGWMITRHDFPWSFGVWIYNGNARFSGREFLFETMGR